MPTIRPPDRKRRETVQPPKSKGRRRRGGIRLVSIEDLPPALSRSISLDTVTTSVPRRIRLVPKSGPRPKAAVEVDLPEGTVVRLIVLGEGNDFVDTLVEGWLPAGRHELCDLCLPPGVYKLRLETPNAWHVAGLMVG